MGHEKVILRHASNAAIAGVGCFGGVFSVFAAILYFQTHNLLLLGSNLAVIALTSLLIGLPFFAGMMMGPRSRISRSLHAWGGFGGGALFFVLAIGTTRWLATRQFLYSMEAVQFAISVLALVSGVVSALCLSRIKPQRTSSQ